MQKKTVLAEIKRGLEPYVGCRIKLRANKGRQKIVEREGILESTYPNLFVVRFDEQNHGRRVSYCYSDILTETIKLQMVSPDGSVVPLKSIG